MNTDFINIVRYASKAPSGHNTQPWKFHITDDTITILPDLSKVLPIVDGDNRELFISLGCATENLCIAANYLGYESHTIESGTKGITIQLTKNHGMIEDPLFYQIEKRQSNRSIYSSERIPNEVFKQLQTIKKENHIQLYSAEIGTPLANILTEYIKKGNELQMNDITFKNELLTWMRFNKKQIEATKDGLSYQVFGNPSLPKLVSKFIVNLFLKPSVQNKSDMKKIASSSHLILFTTRLNSLEEWIDLGSTLQRFLLKATESGIACAFLNQPCEVEALSKELQRILPINNEYPTLIIRIGYSKALPYSPRKEITGLLI